MPVLPGAEPFTHDGSSTGVLLIHGFTSSPQSLRPWAEHLAAQDMTVRLPRLPGHGTTWQEMNRTRWEDWYADVERDFRELHERCDRVFIGGLSMGGGIALALAQEHGPRVSGLVLVNPAVLFKDWRVRFVPLLKNVVGGLDARELHGRVVRNVGGQALAHRLQRSRGVGSRRQAERQHQRGERSQHVARVVG